MNGIPEAILFIGVIPALFLLFISLKGYEGYYKEKNIFLTFVVGIIAGAIAIMIEWFTIQVGIFFIILFPVLEQIIKTMILNIGRFHGKKETTIYGLSLGLGFGSIFTPFSIITSNLQNTVDSYSLLLVIIISIGIILLHGATGACIGYGIFDGKIMKYYILAVLMHLPITITVLVTTIYSVGYLQIGLVVYGLIIYWYVTKKIMPQILSQRKRKRSKKT